MLYIYHRSNRIPLLCKRLKRRFKGALITEESYPNLKAGDIVINYGCSLTPLWAGLAAQRGVRVINHWKAVRRCANKLLSLQHLSNSGVRALQFTTEREEAAEWPRVVVRHKLQGTRGEGIQIVERKHDAHIPSAPLYTKYFRKTHEFRVHVFDGEVIDYTQKKRMLEDKIKERNVEPIKYVRNHASGWVFCREDILHSKEIEDLALKAAEVLGVDYCGVDILANFDEENNYVNSIVCELNSAPGMVKTTYKNYIKAIREAM